MSQTKTLTVARGTVTRTNDNGSGGQGCGNSKRLYVGRHGSAGSRRNYDSYLIFGLPLSDVGSIVSATLNLWTDDLAGGLFGALTAPHFIARRLTASFTEGNNADTVFDSSDFTTAPTTGTGQAVINATKVANGLTQVDVTAMVKAWAPANVAGGGKATNYGMVLNGSSDESQEWSGWSEDAADSSKHPTITLVYELGPTTPDTPTDMSPSGEVASISAFQADFTDPRPTDTLARTHVQVYLTDSPQSATIDTADVVHANGHGLVNGAEVWFHTLTGGTGLSTAVAYYVRDRAANSFKVATTPGGLAVNVTVAYSASTFASPFSTQNKVASATEIGNARSNVVPDNLTLIRNQEYFWRVRQQDQEGRWSLWTILVGFTVTNTNPDPPTITPDDETFDSLIGILFRGGAFTDDDAGDTLGAYQLQMTLFPEGDPGWDNVNASNLFWDTGKQYVASGSTSWETSYTGTSVDADTYYIRARQWDNHDGVSDWVYTSITLTDDFDQQPGTQPSIQIDPKAPWRIRIREMKFDPLAPGAITGVFSTGLFTTANNHGLTVNRRVRIVTKTGGTGIIIGRDYYVIASGLAAKTFRLSKAVGGASIHTTDWTSTNVSAMTMSAIIKRGPGNVIAILENAKSVGASIVYNSPGEAHFTLPVDNPNIGVIEPKQVHYGVDFYGADGWRETFAGLVDDADATETEVVFTCFDYLALLDRVYDSRYFPADPNRSYDKGGSHYEQKSIRTIVLDQLAQVTTRTPNSELGFVTIGSVATMNELLTIDSTMQPTLSFLGGVIDSHRQGTGKRTRLEVRRKNDGGYEFVVTDDPGTVRSNLRLRYGELVQGYRVVIFGPQWASTVHGIGRRRDGLRVLFETRNAPGIDQTVFGHVGLASIFENVADEIDLKRRVAQAALHAGKLGKNIGIAIRTMVLQPRRGYDICDVIPVDIVHGAVNTNNFGSGFWTAMAIAWEGGDDASQTTTITLLPREDTTSPSDDLVGSQPISPQAEWQIGHQPPNPISASSLYWRDERAGITYRREDGTLVAIGITGTP